MVARAPPWPSCSRPRPSRGRGRGSVGDHVRCRAHHRPDPGRRLGAHGDLGRVAPPARAAGRVVVLAASWAARSCSSVRRWRRRRGRRRAANAAPRFAGSRWPCCRRSVCTWRSASPTDCSVPSPARDRVATRRARALPCYLLGSPRPPLPPVAIVVAARDPLVAIVGFFAVPLPRRARTNAPGSNGSRGRSSSRGPSPSWSPCSTSWCRGRKRCAASRPHHRAHPAVAGARRVGAHRSADRPPARAHHHLGGARGHGGRVLPAHRPRSRARADGDEQTLLGLSMLAAAVAALLWIPVRERLTDVATRRVYGERHAPDEVLRTFGSRLTRALAARRAAAAARGVAEEDDGRSSVAEVWTRGAGGARARGVGARARDGSHRDRRGRRAGDRARRCVGRGVGEDLAARSARRRRRRDPARRADHQHRRVARPHRRAPARRRAAVRRSRRAGADGARPSGRARAAQREARLRAAGVARRGAAPGRRAARVAHPHRRSRRRATTRASSATCTTARSSTSSRSP